MLTQDLRMWPYVDVEKYLSKELEIISFYIQNGVSIQWCVLGRKHTQRNFVFLTQLCILNQLDPGTLTRGGKGIKK